MLNTKIPSIRELLLMFGILLLSGCATSQLPPSEYSRIWKTAPPQQRGRMADMKLCYDHLHGKGPEAVKDFLGEPDSRQDENWLYDLGTMNGPHRWTLRITFDQKDRVVRVVGEKQ